jgi:hypothetical protein
VWLELKPREERMGGGGPAVRTPHGTEWVWGLAPTGGRCPNRVPANRGPTAAHAGGAALFE